MFQEDSFGFQGHLIAETTLFDKVSKWLCKVLFSHDVGFGYSLPLVTTAVAFVQAWIASTMVRLENACLQRRLSVICKHTTHLVKAGQETESNKNMVIPFSLENRIEI